MDSMNTPEEMEVAIRERIQDEEMKIENVRPNANDTQAATIITTETAAQKLLEHTIKVGMVNCTLERRIDMERCYKCWAVGHTSKKCTGPDRSKMCQKCGEEGHKAKECRNAEKCPACKEEGHRAYSGRCRMFKRELQKARKKEKEKNSDEN
ncbi:hypothetical protein WA026_005368 [Henosepilachna vigintioctopunctata]|uniref:CCHC-type domain-containing protein n=1 Tax=Henosepilachna vigintioctopunctata TaxID=420089 RepID=A0AAW1U1J7_9CUCU